MGSPRRMAKRARWSSTILRAEAPLSRDGDNSSDDESGPFDALLREVARADAQPPPPANDSLIGAVLDHYRIVSKLGQGGMGVVYRAEDVELRREVALKVLPSSVAGDLERRRRVLYPLCQGS